MEETEKSTAITLSTKGLTFETDDMSWQTCALGLGALVCFTVIVVWLFKWRIAVSRRRRKTREQGAQNE